MADAVAGLLAEVGRLADGRVGEVVSRAMAAGAVYLGDDWQCDWWDARDEKRRFNADWGDLRTHEMSNLLRRRFYQEQTQLRNRLRWAMKCRWCYRCVNKNRRLVRCPIS